MQLEISAESGNKLPGSNLHESFQVCEFLTQIGRTEQGMICYLKLEFENPELLKKQHQAIEILEVKYQTEKSALVIALTKGPIPRIFSDNDEVWWIGPTFLNHKGITMTIRGTKRAIREVRGKISKLVGDGISVKLGVEAVHNPVSTSMLPEKQQIVLDKAIEMGYYSRPRGCTQRDIAKVLDLKQATISEHLQSAESKIINSLGNLS
jgi:predicted DNA binding protein